VAKAKSFLLFSFALILFIFLFGKIEAANQDIIITEIMYDLPGNDEGREWIELYNKGTEEVTIVGGSTSNSWRFFDGTSNRILSPTPYQGSLTIKPGEYVILVQDPLKFKEDYPDFPDSITIIQVSAMSLKNTSNTIGLRIGSQGDLWSQVSYDQTLGANGNGKSLERLGTTDSFLESLVEKGTPGKENSVNSAQNQPTPTPAPTFQTTPTLSPTPTPTFSPSPTPTPSFEYFPSDVVINEFLPDPPDGEEEWIELYNNTQKEIDLTGWYIEEGSGAQTFLSGKILPRGFFVVEKIKGYLNNSGDIIFLKDKTGNVIDKVTYGNFDDGNIEDNAPTAKDPYSIARVFDGKDTNQDNLDFKISNSTKGAKNQVLGSISFVSNIIINEILPNPKGDDSENEFIELKNLNNFDVDLENWYLQDLSNTKFVLSSKKISTKIPKNGFLVIYRKDSNIALNNTDKDCLKLFQPDGTLVDSVCYSGKVLEDVSFAKTQKGDFEWTEKLTPGTENVILKPNSPPTAQISANKEKAFVGEEVIFDGSDSFDPDGDELEFLWDFGDNTKKEGVYVSHSFSKPKTYTVSLEIKDEKGAKDKATLKIEILEKKEGKLTTQTESRISQDFQNLSGQIFISEILPDPKGKDDEREFIEIFNNFSKEIDLSGWFLDDDEGQSQPYKIPEGTKILPKQYLVFWRKETKIALNNSADKVRIFDPQNNLIDEVSFEKSKEGFSFAKNEDGEFEWTEILTPGDKNQFSNKKEDFLAKKEEFSASLSQNPTKIPSFVWKISLISFFVALCLGGIWLFVKKKFLLK